MRGQSLPDWAAWRSGGKFLFFLMAWLFSTTSQQVAELLALCQTHNWVMISYGGGICCGHINPIADERPILTFVFGATKSIDCLRWLLN